MSYSLYDQRFSGYRIFIIMSFMLIILGRLTWIQQKSYFYHSRPQELALLINLIGERSEDCSVSYESEEEAFLAPVAKTINSPSLASQFPFTYLLSKKICKEGRLTFAEATRQNQWILISALFFLALLLRSHMNGWSPALVGIAGVMSRGSVTEHVGDLGLWNEILLLNAISFLAMECFRRFKQAVFVYIGTACIWIAAALNPIAITLLVPMTYLINQAKVQQKGLRWPVGILIVIHILLAPLFFKHVQEWIYAGHWMQMAQIQMSPKEASPLSFFSQLNVFKRSLDSYWWIAMSFLVLFIKGRPRGSQFLLLWILSVICVEIILTLAIARPLPDHLALTKHMSWSGFYFAASYVELFLVGFASAQAFKSAEVLLRKYLRRWKKS